MLCWGSPEQIVTALDEVTQTSLHIFISEVELT